MKLDAVETISFLHIGCVCFPRGSNTPAGLLSVDLLQHLLSFSLHCVRLKLFYFILEYKLF